MEKKPNHNRTEKNAKREWEKPEVFVLNYQETSADLQDAIVGS